MSEAPDPRLPIRDRIADALRARIAEGRYPAGSLLPGIKEIQAEFGCSDMPVRQAFAALATEGTIVTKQGTNARVSAPPAESPPPPLPSSDGTVAFTVPLDTCQVTVTLTRTLTPDEHQRLVQLITDAAPLLTNR